MAIKKIHGMAFGITFSLVYTFENLWFALQDFFTKENILDLSKYTLSEIESHTFPPALKYLANTSTVYLIFSILGFFSIILTYISDLRTRNGILWNNGSSNTEAEFRKYFMHRKSYF